MPRWYRLVGSCYVPSTRQLYGIILCVGNTEYFSQHRVAFFPFSTDRLYEKATDCEMRLGGLLSNLTVLDNRAFSAPPARELVCYREMKSVRSRK